jgi:hypothetical protein
MGSHATTLEFTKDDFLTKQGDCIIGINADFELAKLKEFLKGKKKIKVTIECDGVKDEFSCEVNPAFNSDHEIVIRRGTFNSERTLGINADKAASVIKRALIEKLKDTESNAAITLQAI